jgi:hypothetical protein
MQKRRKRDRVQLAVAVVLLIVFYIFGENLQYLRWNGSSAKGRKIVPNWLIENDPEGERDVLPGGCFLPSPNVYIGNNTPILRTEAELAKFRPKNFHRMADFDYEPRMVPSEALGGVVEFHDTYILSKYQITFNCDVVYVPPGCKAATTSKEEILSLVSHGHTEELDTVVVIAQFWGNSYYHAMIEDLPRLALVLDILRADPSAAVLSYPQSLTQPTSREWLFNRLLGLGKSRKWIPFDEDKAYFAKKVFIPTATRCGNGQPRALTLIRDTIYGNVPIVLGETLDKFWVRYPEIHTGGNLLIVVQKRVSRSLLNHDDLVEALKTEFVNCCTVIEFLGSEAMEECIVMHHHARVIVGPHGAGLSNVVFAPSDAALVEIHPKAGNVNGTQINLCHQSTAKSLGLETRMLVQTSGGIWGSSFLVDVESVVNTVRELLI